jgi:AraC-like DNA-binding protein
VPKLFALFVFEYQYDDYNLMMQAVAKQLNVDIVKDSFVFPPDIGDGYYRVLNLPNGLQATMVNCTFARNWYLHRTRSSEEYYTLRLDEFTIPNKLVLSVDDQKQTEQHTSKMLVYLTSSLFDFSYLGTAGTRARGISILLKPDFISQYLGLSSVDDLLRNYIALKAENYNAVLGDTSYRDLLNDIMYKDADKPFADLYLLNRLQLMIEKFFTRLHQLANSKPLNLRLSNADINRIMQAEHILTHDFGRRPPSIAQLAEASAMSVSSFKSNFKLVYSQPVYSHYQHQRLNKAQQLLASGKYSVKDVAEAVAYENTSNFIAAFKKQFQVSPGVLLQM